MTNSYEIQETEIIQETNNPTVVDGIKLLEIIPADKIYTIHNDLRKYHNKWNKDQVIELADTAGIANFYTITQYLTRTIPIAGAGLAIKGDAQTGAIIAAVSLYTDFLITRGKEKLFQSEEKKKQLEDFNKDIGNLYDKHEELAEILKPLHNSSSSSELNNLLEKLKEDLNKFTKKEWKEEKEKGKLREYSELVFWTLREGKSSDIKELNLLNNGIKSLEGWNELHWAKKFKEEFTRLFISLREGDKLWGEWEKQWEIRRSEHENIKRLVSILQTAIIENNQGISNEKIEERIRKEVTMLELKKETIELFWKFLFLKGDLKKLTNKNSFVWYEKHDKKDEVDKDNNNEEDWVDKDNKELKKELKYKDDKRAILVSYLVEELWKVKWSAEMKERITILKNDLEEEIEELKYIQKESWGQWFRRNCCCGKDKNEPSLWESLNLSLDSEEKEKKIQEIIENQETTSEKSIINTSQPTNVFRKRNTSNSKENRPSQEIYIDLQSKEELQTKIEVLPK